MWIVATIGSLVSGLAHEIRTPLAAIVNEANLIERQVQRALAADDPKPNLAGVSERVESLDGAVDRIRALMRDMRTFMRGEVPRSGETDLSATVEDEVLVEVWDEPDVAPLHAYPYARRAGGRSSARNAYGTRAAEDFPCLQPSCGPRWSPTRSSPRRWSPFRTRSAPSCHEAFVPLAALVTFKYHA